MSIATPPRRHALPLSQHALALAAFVIAWIATQPSTVLSAEPEGPASLVYEILDGVQPEEAIRISNRRLSEFMSGRAEASLDDAGRMVVSLRDRNDTALVRSVIGEAHTLFFTIVASDDPEELRAAAVAPVEADDQTLAPTAAPSEPHLLIYREDAVPTGARITGLHIRQATSAMSPDGAGFAVSIVLDLAGAEAFAALTAQHVGDRLAIVLDGEILSAPRINAPIADGRLVIDGDFSPEAAQELAAMIMAAALPSPLRLLEEASTAQ